jgi:hypothetical protein
LTLITLITLIILNILLKLLYVLYVPFHLATVVPDDDSQCGHDKEHWPSQSQTPPTPPVHPGSSQSPPPSASPMHQRCMAKTICHTMHFAKSCPLQCLNNFLSVLSQLYHLLHYPRKQIKRTIYHLFSISLHSPWPIGQHTLHWLC